MAHEDSTHSTKTSEEVTEPLGLDVEADAPSKVFVSWQLTAKAHTELSQLVRGDADVRASAPDFNERKVAEWTATRRYNVPSYGMLVPAAVYDLFDCNELQGLAREFKMPTPVYKFDTFVHGKAHKIGKLVNHLRTLPATADCKVGVVADNLERFLVAYQALNADEIKSAGDWEAFLKQCGLPVDWKRKLHFDHVLCMFGATPELSRQIQETTFDDRGEQVTYERYSYRWLSKAIGGYKVAGCITDVLNLIYAVMGVEGKGHSEYQAAETVHAFTSALRRKDLNGMWIPEVFGHDAETDDVLSWILLEYLHILQGTSLCVVVQLPVSDDLDELEALLTVSRGHAFRDPDSGNLKAVMKNHGIKST